MNLPRLILTADIHRIDARVARTEADRLQGLMHCASLGEDEGMLFIHDAPTEACFWMKDTPLHLSIAFIDDAGRVLNIEEMQAHCLDGVRAAGPVRYVLEMNQGWFGARSIAPGARVSGLPGAGSA